MNSEAFQSAYLFIFRGKDIVVPDSAGFQHATRESISEWEALGATYHAVDWHAENSDYWAKVPDDYALREGEQALSLRDFAEQTDYDLFVRAGSALQLMGWIQNTRFCGKCGCLMQDHSSERARICPNCTYITYPTISPAIIVAVEKGDRLLLARSPHFRANMMSVLAGFVEVGETLEQTVIREVYEETGIRVKNIRYFGSQPWPFPHSLMLGFTAKWESGDILIDGVEIVDAGWYTAENAPVLPGKVSIAGKLINHWLNKQKKKKKGAGR